MYSKLSTYVYASRRGKCNTLDVKVDLNLSLNCSSNHLSAFDTKKDKIVPRCHESVLSDQIFSCYNSNDRIWIFFFCWNTRGYMADRALLSLKVEKYPKSKSVPKLRI